MPDQNVEIARQVFTLWRRGDFEGGRDYFDDACEVRFSTSSFLLSGTHRIGRQALRAWVDFVEAFETFETGIDKVLDRGERVIALAWIRGRGRTSGVDVDAQVGTVFTFRDGKIVRYELTDKREALAAAGLSE